MAFEAAALVRDGLYLAGLLGGAALGAAAPLAFRRRRLPRRERAGRRLSSALLAALALASATVSFIVSGGTAFGDGELLAVAACLFSAAAAGTLFPGIVGFPLAVAVGTAAALFSWSFLLYPEASEGAVVGRFRLGASGEAKIWLAGDSVPGRSLDAPDADRLSFTILRIDFDRRIPLVGATSRAALKDALVGGSAADLRTGRALPELLGEGAGGFLFSVPGVSSRTFTVEYSAAQADPGVRKDLVWKDGRPEIAP